LRLPRFSQYKPEIQSALFKQKMFTLTMNSPRLLQSLTMKTTTWTHLKTILTRRLRKRAQSLPHQVVAVNRLHRVVLEVEAVLALHRKALMHLLGTIKLRSLLSLSATAVTVTISPRSTPSSTPTKTIFTRLPRVKLIPNSRLKLRKNLPLTLQTKNKQS